VRVDGVVGVELPSVPCYFGCPLLLYIMPRGLIQPSFGCKIKILLKTNQNATI